MTGREAVIGVDLGTTSTKVLVQTTDGLQLALIEAPTPWCTTAAGGTQTTPEVLTQLVLHTLTRAMEQAQATGGPVRVLGVGVTGLAESGVLLDRSGRCCAPVIAWFDRRGEAQVARVSHQRQDFGRSFARSTGLPWDCQASVAKLLWLADQGLTLTGGHRWLSVPEYIVYALGGELVSEPSLASRTGLVDQATGRSWTEGLSELGLPPSLLPPRIAAGVSASRVTMRGLPAGVVGAGLTVAGHDHPVAAVGAGATGADDLFNSTGTADVIARSLPAALSGDQREELVRLGFSAGAHVLAGSTLILGGARGGLVLRRVLSLLGGHDRAVRDRLDADALLIGQLPAGLSIAGAGPTGDDVIVHLRDDAGPAALWATATRYTAGETGTLLTTLHRVVTPHRRAIASGGWTRMASVRQAKSAAIERLEFSDVAEPGVVGSARLALQADGGSSAVVPRSTPSPV